MAFWLLTRVKDRYQAVKKVSFPASNDKEDSRIKQLSSEICFY